MKIQKKERNLLIAMTLGDGYIGKDGIFSCLHSSKQKEYIEWKHGLIESISKPIVSKNNNGFDAYIFKSKALTFLKVLRRVLYPNNKKTLNRKILNRVDLQGLAIWWMDDGTKGVKYNKDKTKIKACVYRLCLCSTKEQCQLVIDWLFETYNIKFGITKEKNNYSITCGTREGRKFSDLIRPYVIPSMLYKIS